MKPFPVLILAALLALAGCDFDAPLTGKPTRAVDPDLVGSWFSSDDGSKLEIYRLSKDEYLALFDGKPYVCTHSDLAGASFISCKGLSNDREYGKYSYIAYKLKNGELTLTHLSDSLNFKDHASPSEIRKTIENALKDGKALDSDPKHEQHYKKKREE